MTLTTTLYLGFSISGSKLSVVSKKADFTGDGSPVKCEKSSDMNFAKTLPKNGAVGTLHLEFKRCGRPRCQCTKGLLHGPYVYLHRRSGKRQKKVYVAMRDVGQLVLWLEEIKGALPRPWAMRKAFHGGYHD